MISRSLHNYGIRHHISVPEHLVAVLGANATPAESQISQLLSDADLERINSELLALKP